MPRTRASAPAKTRHRPEPVTVTRMRVVSCALCGQRLDAHTKTASEVLTEHYQELHPEAGHG